MTRAIFIVEIIFTPSLMVTAFLMAADLFREIAGRPSGVRR